MLTQALAEAENDSEGNDRGLLGDEDEDFLEAARAALPESTSAVQLLDQQGQVLVNYGAGSRAQPIGADRGPA